MSAEVHELVEVHLVQMPLDLMAQAQEHGEGLTREFALIATSLSSDSVPVRLQQLSDQLSGQYSMFTEDVQRQIDEAMERGDPVIDVTYSLPPSVSDACMVLNDLLEEADEFCRNGDLLTLETPPEYARLRRWFLGEFVRQVEGHKPVPWPEYEDAWPPRP